MTKRSRSSSSANHLPLQKVRKFRGNNLTNESVQILTNWYNEHITDPYPNKIESDQLAELCRIDSKKVRCWFNNKRARNKRSNNVSNNQRKYNEHVNELELLEVNLPSPISKDETISDDSGISEEKQNISEYSTLSITPSNYTTCNDNIYNFMNSTSNESGITQPTILSTESESKEEELGEYDNLFVECYNNEYYQSYLQYLNYIWYFQYYQQLQLGSQGLSNEHLNDQSNYQYYSSYSQNDIEQLNNTNSTEH
ncbi:hypothetical protein SNEBB_009453 [Seison nebaliae]|nr:hypothetical protein SNEBB_009453 [Seison nebaliae]